eukprot:jgi/Mesvir1/1048/Mv17571-RA.1
MGPGSGESLEEGEGVGGRPTKRGQGWQVDGPIGIESQRSEDKAKAGPLTAGKWTAPNETQREETLADIDLNTYAPVDYETAILHMGAPGILPDGRNGSEVFGDVIDSSEQKGEVSEAVELPLLKAHLLHKQLKQKRAEEMEAEARTKAKLLAKRQAALEEEERKAALAAAKKQAAKEAAAAEAAKRQAAKEEEERKAAAKRQAIKEEEERQKAAEAARQAAEIAAAKLEHHLTWTKDIHNDPLDWQVSSKSLAAAASLSLNRGTGGSRRPAQSHSHTSPSSTHGSTGSPAHATSTHPSASGPTSVTHRTQQQASSGGTSPISRGGGHGPSVSSGHGGGRVGSAGLLKPLVGSDEWFRRRHRRRRRRSLLMFGQARDARDRPVLGAHVDDHMPHIYGYGVPHVQPAVVPQVIYLDPTDPHHPGMHQVVPQVIPQVVYVESHPPATRPVSYLELGGHLQPGALPGGVDVDPRAHAQPGAHQAVDLDVRGQQPHTGAWHVGEQADPMGHPHPGTQQMADLAGIAGSHAGGAEGDNLLVSAAAAALEAATKLAELAIASQGGSEPSHPGIEGRADVGGAVEHHAAAPYGPSLGAIPPVPAGVISRQEHGSEAERAAAASYRGADADGSHRRDALAGILGGSGGGEVGLAGAEEVAENGATVHGRFDPSGILARKAKRDAALAAAWRPALGLPTSDGGSGGDDDVGLAPAVEEREPPTAQTRVVVQNGSKAEPSSLVAGTGASLSSLAGTEFALELRATPSQSAQSTKPDELYEEPREDVRGIDMRTPGVIAALQEARAVREDTHALAKLVAHEGGFSHKPLHGAGASGSSVMTRENTRKKGMDAAFPHTKGTREDALSSISELGGDGVEPLVDNVPVDNSVKGLEPLVLIDRVEGPPRVAGKRKGEYLLTQGAEYPRKPAAVPQVVGHVGQAHELPHDIGRDRAARARMDALRRRDARASKAAAAASAAKARAASGGATRGKPSVAPTRATGTPGGGIGEASPFVTEENDGGEYGSDGMEHSVEERPNYHSPRAPYWTTSKFKRDGKGELTAPAELAGPGAKQGARGAVAPAKKSTDKERVAEEAGKSGPRSLSVLAPPDTADDPSDGLVKSADSGRSGSARWETVVGNRPLVRDEGMAYAPTVAEAPVRLAREKGPVAPAKVTKGGKGVPPPATATTATKSAARAGPALPTAGKASVKAVDKAVDKLPEIPGDRPKRWAVIKGLVEAGQEVADTSAMGGASTGPKAGSGAKDAGTNGKAGGTATRKADAAVNSATWDKLLHDQEEAQKGAPKETGLQKNADRLKGSSPQKDTGAPTGSGFQGESGPQETNQAIAPSAKTAQQRVFFADEEGAGASDSAAIPAPKRRGSRARKEQQMFGGVDGFFLRAAQKARGKASVLEGKGKRGKGWGHGGGTRSTMGRSMGMGTMMMTKAMGIRVPPVIMAIMARWGTIMWAIPIVTTRIAIMWAIPIVTTRTAIMWAIPIVTTQTAIMWAIPIVTTRTAIMWAIPIVTTQTAIMWAIPIVTTRTAILWAIPIVTTRTAIMWAIPMMAPWVMTTVTMGPWMGLMRAMMMATMSHLICITLTTIMVNMGRSMGHMRVMMTHMMATLSHLTCITPTTIMAPMASRGARPHPPFRTSMASMRSTRTLTTRTASLRVVLRGQAANQCLQTLSLSSVQAVSSTGAINIR